MTALSTDPVFEEHRSVLHRLAYRMLGSLPDADDVVQEAYLRWSRSDQEAVESSRSYLMSIVTRLCIDQQRSRAARREAYVGPWLPEPVVTTPSRAERAESVSMALMIVLESLSPVERAAYLLRRIFDYDYAELANILGKTEASCRQLVSRAEQRVHDRRPRFEPPVEETERLTDQFVAACSSGDLQGLVDMLTADAVLYSDGGGKVTAARVPVVGGNRLARFLIGVNRKYYDGAETRRVQVNGQPGLMTLYEGEILSVLTFHVVDGRINEIYIVRNPDKLARILKT